MAGRGAVPDLHAGGGRGEASRRPVAGAHRSRNRKAGGRRVEGWEELGVRRGGDGGLKKRSCYYCGTYLRLPQSFAHFRLSPPKQR